VHDLSFAGLGCPQFNFRFRGFDENTCTDEQIDVVPAFDDVVRVFDDEADMEAYITAESYNTGDQVWAGIVFDNAGENAGAAAPGGWSYSVRVNTTFGESFALDTQQPNTDDLTHNLNNLNAGTYANDGFMTLQVLMDRYIMNLEATLADDGGVQVILTNDERLDYVKNLLATYKVFSLDFNAPSFEFSNPVFTEDLLLQVLYCLHAVSNLIVCMRSAILLCACAGRHWSILFIV
jgi:hypothetical protein